MTTPVEIADKLRGAFPDYEPAMLDAEEVAYLEALKLPAEIEAFFRAHSPAKVVGTTSQLLSLSEMRVEHEEMEPSMTVRNAGASVLATANGNPYFVVRKGEGYEIRIVDHDEVSDDNDLDTLLELSGAGPVFTSFADFIDALTAQVLPSSPYSDTEMKKLAAWRAARG